MIRQQISDVHPYPPEKTKEEVTPPQQKRMRLLRATGVAIALAVGMGIAVWGFRAAEYQYRVTILGEEENAILDIAIEMYGSLQGWRAKNIPNQPPVRESLDGKTQVRTVAAFFTFLTKEGFTGVVAADNPDGEFLAWLHACLPESSDWVKEVDKKASGNAPLYLMREEVIAELNKLAGHLRDKTGYGGTNDPGVKALMRAFGESLDYQSWYTKGPRKWVYGGAYPKDGEAREMALAFYRGGAQPDNRDDIGKLRRLLADLGADDFFNDDMTRRPWLILCSFCEFFSLERFGFDSGNHDKEKYRLFPLSPVLERGEFARDAFAGNTPRRVVEALAEGRFGVESEIGNFDEFFTDARKFYTDPRNFHREILRLGDAVEDSAEGRYQKALNEMVRHLEAENPY